MFYRLAHRHAPEVSHSSIFISVTDCRLTDFYQEFKWQHSNTHNTASLVTVGSGEGVGRRLLQLVHCSLPHPQYPPTAPLMAPSWNRYCRNTMQIYTKQVMFWIRSLFLATSWRCVCPPNCEKLWERTSERKINDDRSDQTVNLAR